MFKPACFFKVKKNAILSFVILAIPISLAFSQDVWTEVKPALTTQDLKSVVFGNNQFVTVGVDGTILTSTDATAWIKKTSGVTATLYGICVKPGMFVAVGDSGTVLTSVDGSTWKKQTSPVKTQLHSVAWNGTVFVAVGFQGSIIRSTDGITWVNHSLKETTELNGVEWGDNKFVAVGFSGVAGTVNTSTDGITWSTTTVYGTEGFYSVSWCNSSFYVGTNPLWKSADGTNWVEASGAIDNYAFGIVYHQNQLVAVGANGLILLSTNGTEWTSPQTSSISAFLNSVTWGNDKYVTVGSEGTIAISNSSNGVVFKKKLIDKNIDLTITSKGMLFSLKSNNNVSILLFNAQGRQIRTLVNSKMNAGSHVVAFSEGLPTGRYLLSFVAGTQKICQSVVITK